MSEYFPTDFAKRLARRVSLYPRREIYDYDEWSEDEKVIRRRNRALALHKALSEFQELSISCKLEESLVAYHDIELNEEQNGILKIIHESTASWVMGTLVQKLLTHIAASSTSKDTKELSEILMSIIKGDTEGGGNAQKFEALIIKTTKREDPIDGK